jgi:uncharacterized protein
MSVTLYPSANYQRQPWRNGGGWTNEVAKLVDHQTLADWTWRISLAEIESSGPFSQFPHVERILVLLEGHGIELTVDGHRHVLREQYAHIRFAGEAAVHCSLIDGPTRDLNVMFRHSGNHIPDAQVFHRMIGGTFSVTAQPGELWVMLLTGNTTISGPELGATAGPDDTIVIDATASDTSIRQSFLGTGTVILVRVRGTAQTSGRL